MITNKQFITEDLIEGQKQKIILIKSQQGTGKSTMFREYIKENKDQFIFIASRISLIVDQKDKFDKYSHNKIKSKLYNDEDNRKKLKQGDNIFICINSLLKLDKFDFSNYVIFFDEVQTTIETLLFSTNIENIEKVKLFDLLTKVLNTSKLIIGVESEISQVLINFIKDYINKTSIKDFIKKNNDNVLVITNQYKKYKDIKVKFGTNVLGKIKNLNKYIIATDTRLKALELHKYFNNKNDVKLIVADDKFLFNRKRRPKKINPECFDLDKHKKIIYSPKITHGVDSSLRRSVFSFYTGFSSLWFNRSHDVEI